MTSKQTDFTELNALAVEACDMWQEHLSTLANDPAARAELTRFLEPQRRLFADWVSMMQRGAAAGAQATQANNAQSAQTPSPENLSTASSEPSMTGGRHERNARPQAAASSSATGDVSAESEPPSRRDEYGDDALRVAQLAYRVAELEKRLAQFESMLNAAPGTSRRAQRTSS